MKRDRLILVAGWGLFLLYCYPGYMSADSSVQLAQARGLEPVSNWHPPLMAYLWRYCDMIVSGPFLMLVIQSVSLLVGMFLLLRRVLSERGAAIAAVLILLSPPVLPPMGVIWKDSQMAGFLMLAMGVMLSPRRGAQVAGCALIWLATAQRYNAAAATLPVLLGLFVWTWPSGWKRYALATGLWVAITASSMAVNSALADKKEDVFASLALNDITGIIRFHEDYTDDEIRRDAPGLPWIHDADLAQSARTIYRPYMTWLDWAGGSGIYVYPRTPEASAAVATAWRRLIVKHPISYLQHRVRVFLTELRVTHRFNFYLWWNLTDGPWSDDRLDLHHTHTWIQDRWIDFLTLLVSTPIYWAWVYFVAGAVLLYLSRRDRIAFTIAASGIACELGLFIAAPAIDYRYSHWMVTCTILAAVYHVASGRRSRGHGGVG